MNVHVQSTHVTFRCLPTHLAKKILDELSYINFFFTQNIRLKLQNSELSLQPPYPQTVRNYTHRT